MSLVSIITPAYNVEKYIGKTIDSVLNQTYEDWEMLIVDDGSTDGTKKAVEKYLSDPRINYFYQQNGRQGKARNLAIKQAKGKYLAFLDADDLWVPSKLEQQVSTIESENVDFVYSQGWTFQDDENNPENTKDLMEMNVLLGYQTSKEFLEKLLTRNQIPILSVLVHKNIVDSVGGFSETLNVQNAEDYQLWVKLADNGANFYGMEERLFYYRLHANQSTSGDNMSMEACIWGLSELQFKSFSEEEKKKRIIKLLNKYTLYACDKDSGYFLALLRLYKEPLNSQGLYIKRWLQSRLGRKVFKKIGYRFFYEV